MKTWCWWPLGWDVFVYLRRWRPMWDGFSPLPCLRLYDDYLVNHPDELARTIRHEHRHAEQWWVVFFVLWFAGWVAPIPQGWWTWLVPILIATFIRLLPWFEADAQAAE